MQNWSIIGPTYPLKTSLTTHHKNPDGRDPESGVY